MRAFLTRHAALIGLAFIVVAVFGQGHNSRVALKNSDRAGRVELVMSQRSGCGRSVADRQDDIRRIRAAIRANLLVATDPGQPRRTRAARRVQVAADRAAMRGKLSRVPPVFSCAQAYPLPRP